MSRASAPPPYTSIDHAVLWQDETPVDLGDSLGGPAGASAINEGGDVSGTLWTPETRKAVPLQPPPGFVAAVNGCCKTINARREIVGFLFDANFNSYAFLWKDGVMVDLNSLIPKGSPWKLQSAASINDSGQIAGTGQINREVHAFLATPCHHHEGRGECCENHDH
ncbi:MAG TPA: hypothetical protein VFB14_29025 [Bryobacteraceae bacterium]|nr:hypothetical protein [Bryobacteraceae bacterium]